MSWFSSFISSSIGQKLIMSLTGLFLIIFLVVHLVGNLQLMLADGGQQFNLYAKFMTSNPLIKTISYGLYAFILLHAFQGLYIKWRNMQSRGQQKYAVKVTRAVNTNATAAKYMAQLGIIIFVFLIIHMYQFWFKMKIGALEMVQYEGVDYTVSNLYAPVAVAFSNPFFVVFYVISMIIVAVHLWHGFQSAFQTLGLNHKKYTPFIQFLGKAYSILIPVGFAIIPIFFFLFRNINS